VRVVKQEEEDGLEALELALGAMVVGRKMLE